MRAIRHLTLLAAALGLCACGWLADKRYDYPAWGFSVVFPEPPKVVEEPATEGHVASFEAKLDNGAGQIKSVMVVDTAPDETLDSIVKAHSARVAAAVQGDAGAPTAVTTSGGVVGREVRFRYNGRPVFIARYFLLGRRLYELDASAIDGLDDPFTTSFLTSFRITAGAPARANAP
jgi:hypothetical protein